MEQGNTESFSALQHPTSWEFQWAESEICGYNDWRHEKLETESTYVVNATAQVAQEYDGE